MGLRKLRHACQTHPLQLENHNRLLKAYIYLEDTSSAADVAEETLQHFVSEKLVARAIALALKVGTGERVARLLERGLQRFPNSAVLKQFQG